MPAQWRTFLIGCGTTLSEVGRQLEEESASKLRLQREVDELRNLTRDISSREREVGLQEEINGLRAELEHERRVMKSISSRFVSGEMKYSVAKIIYQRLSLDEFRLSAILIKQWYKGMMYSKKSKSVESLGGRVQKSKGSRAVKLFSKTMFRMLSNMNHTERTGGQRRYIAMWKRNMSKLQMAALKKENQRLEMGYNRSKEMVTRLHAQTKTAHFQRGLLVLSSVTTVDAARRAVVTWRQMQHASSMRTCMEGARQHISHLLLHLIRHRLAIRGALMQHSVMTATRNWQEGAQNNTHADVISKHHQKMRRSGLGKLGSYFRQMMYGSSSRLLAIWRQNVHNNNIQVKISDHKKEVKELQAEHEVALLSVKNQHTAMVKGMQTTHAFAVEEMQKRYTSLMEETQHQHTAAVAELKAQQTSAAEELKAQHMAALEAANQEKERMIREKELYCDKVIKEKEDHLATIINEKESMLCITIEEKEAFCESTIKEKEKACHALLQEKDSLLAELKASHSATVMRMESDHNTKIEGLERQMAEMMATHTRTVEKLVSDNKASVEKTTAEYTATIEQLTAEHTAEIDRISTKHVSTVEVLVAENHDLSAEKDDLSAEKDLITIKSNRLKAAGNMIEVFTLFEKRVRASLTNWRMNVMNQAWESLKDTSKSLEATKFERQAVTVRGFFSTLKAARTQENLKGIANCVQNWRIEMRMEKADKRLCSNVDLLKQQCGVDVNDLTEKHENEILLLKLEYNKQIDRIKLEHKEVEVSLQKELGDVKADTLKQVLEERDRWSTDLDAAAEMQTTVALDHENALRALQEEHDRVFEKRMKKYKAETEAHKNADCRQKGLLVAKSFLFLETTFNIVFHRNVLKRWYDSTKASLWDSKVTSIETQFIQQLAEKRVMYEKKIGSTAGQNFVRQLLRMVKFMEQRDCRAAIARMRANHIMNTGLATTVELQQDIEKLRGLKQKLEDKVKSNKKYMADVDADFAEAKFMAQKSQEKLASAKRDIEDLRQKLKESEDVVIQRDKMVETLEDGIKAEMKARMKMQDQLNSNTKGEAVENSQNQRAIADKLKQEVQQLQTDLQEEMEAREGLETEVRLLQAKLREQGSRGGQESLEVSPVPKFGVQYGSPIAHTPLGETKMKKAKKQTELRRRASVNPDSLDDQALSPSLVSPTSPKRIDDMVAELGQLQRDLLNTKPGPERDTLKKKIDAMDQWVEAESTKIREANMKKKAAAKAVKMKGDVVEEETQKSREGRTKMNDLSDLQKMAPSSQTVQQELNPNSEAILNEYFKLYDSNNDGVVNSADADFMHLTSSFLFKIKVKMARKEVVKRVNEFSKHSIPMTIDEYAAWILAEFGDALPETHDLQGSVHSGSNNAGI